MTAIARQSEPVPSSGYDAYVVRIDKERRGRLVRRNRLFLTTLLREHPQLAKKAVEEAEKAKQEARRARAQARIVKPVLALPAPGSGSDCASEGQAKSEPIKMGRAKMGRGKMGRGMAIVHEIAALHGLNPADLLGHSHKYPIVAARFHAMHEIKQRLGCFTNQIARMFKRDHTSVLHALKRWPVVRERADVVAKLNAAQTALEAAE